MDEHEVRALAERLETMGARTSTRDLALAFDALQGHDPDDPVSSDRTPTPCLPQLDARLHGLRLAVAGGDFRAAGDPEVCAALDRIVAALLRARAGDFDPKTRDMVDVLTARAGALPLGIQLGGAPFAEGHLYRVARHLEAQGLVAAPAEVSGGC